MYAKRTRYLKNEKMDDVESEEEFGEPVPRSKVSKKIDFDTDDLMSLLAKPMVSKPGQSKYRDMVQEASNKDSFGRLGVPMSNAVTKGTVVTAAGTTQYSGSEINMAETYDEDHFSIEIDEELDDDVTPIICEDDDDGPDFTKMNRRQRGAASEIEAQPKRGNQANNRGIDPSSL